MFRSKKISTQKTLVLNDEVLPSPSILFWSTKNTRNHNVHNGFLRVLRATSVSFVFQNTSCFKLFFILSALFLLPVFSFSQIIIKSPDKIISFHLSTKDGALLYAVNFNSLPVIQTSVLSTTINGISFGQNATIGKMTSYKKDETYPYRGVHSTGLNKYSAAKIAVLSNGLPFFIDVRVYNDGVAFRYIISNKDSSIVNKEETSFAIPASSIVWSQSNIKYYEGRYTKKLVDTIKAGDLMGPPITIELPNNAGYAAITEGGLTDFGGMSLKALGNGQFQTNLSGITKKFGTIETPWRIIEIGKDLNTLVNCDIIANVSPSYDKKLFAKGYDTDWVKPGRSVWSWLAKTRSVTLENMKRFSDLASQLGFEYNLVDEGWGYWKDSINHRDQWDMMKELVDYSATKGVKIWVWKAYPDRGGIAGINTAAKRKVFFQKCKDLGVVGLKIDFFDSEAQEIINFYQAALRDAAAYQLMIDFHGSNKPTGEARSFPNEMTREAVRGMENRPPWAASNTTFPFTRYLAGHADYTPIHFGDRMGEVTWAHHIATAIVFTSPFLCYGADPQSMLDNPAKEIIQSIPATWDETIVLPQSKIGELALFARRKRTTWFLAAMNGMHQSETITVPLSFLKKGRYSFLSGKDDAQKQAAIIMENKTYSSADVLTIALNPEGGFAGRFTKN